MVKLKTNFSNHLLHTGSNYLEFSRYLMQGVHRNCQRTISFRRQILRDQIHFAQLLGHPFKNYETIAKPTVYADVNLKSDAVDIFKSAVESVHPKTMVLNRLLYNETTHELKVGGKVYLLNRNVFVVGFGKTVMGMARSVDDLIGHHVVGGIIIIPKGLQQEMTELQLGDTLLSKNSRIRVCEGGENGEADETAHAAAKDIHNLADMLTEKHLLIVLCSGGGSTLCPLPHPPITLQELRDVIRLLKRNGASITELNIIRSNIEILKGGGLALEAKPAKVLSLILSSVISDNPELIASGPTYPALPTPQHCLEILKRLQIMDKTPENIRRFLEKGCKSIEKDERVCAINRLCETGKFKDARNHVQNIVVGDNSLACDAAKRKAAELGYVPLVLTKRMAGEARDVGRLCVLLARFIKLCFDRKSSSETNTELAILETALVAKGIRKPWINCICQKVDTACNSGRDICVIAGGNTGVNVRGTGTGGKNMESTLAAAIQMEEEFKLNPEGVAVRMCFLSCDTKGHDGGTKVAGAVVDNDFLQKVMALGVDMKEYLNNNDAYTLFTQVNDGQNLVVTKLTGTNVKDMMIVLIQRPNRQMG